MRLVASGLPLPLGSVANRRCLVGVENLASLLVACALHPAAPGHTFLAADDEVISTPDLIREIAAGMGRRAVLLPFPVAALRLGLRVDGAERLYEQLCDDLNSEECREWKGVVGTGNDRGSEYQ